MNTKREQYQFAMRQGGLRGHITHASGKRKTVCTSAVLAYFGIDVKSYHYSSCIKQITAILRKNGYAVRSRMSKVKGMSVGKARAKMASWGEEHFIVAVPSHLLLINGKGETVVDTAPRLRDARKIDYIYSVYKE